MYISYKTKKILSIVAIAMLLIFAVVLLAKVMGNLSFSFRDANDDNLYQDLTFADDDGVIEKGENGVAVHLLEDNVIKVKGTAESDLTFLIGSVTLKAGESYVFDSSLTDGSKGTIYMGIYNQSTGDELGTSYRGAVVIDDLVAAESDMVVEIKLFVKDETKVNTKLYPVLCEGDDADKVISFWEK